jgi:uncharacterized membrane-anchored protein YhcB (DUF1043 family)
MVNKNVIVISVIFLVVGLLVGFLVASINTTGEAKSTLKNDFTIETQNQFTTSKYKFKTS